MAGAGRGWVVTATATPSEEAGAVLPVGHPQCLQRRAPLRIELTDAAGRCPTITRRGVLVPAGSRLRVRIVPPRVTDPGPPAKVSVAPDLTLQTVVALTSSGQGATLAYHAEFRGQLSSSLPQFIRDRVPLPCRGELVVAVDDGRFDPLRLVIPILVWPSLRTLLATGLFAVAVFYLAPLLTAQVARTGDPFLATWGLVTDPGVLGRAVAFTSLAVVAFRVLCSLVVFFGLSGDEE